MRFKEFSIVKESSGLGSIIEDEAVTRGDSVLAATLEELRNRAQGTAVPKVRVDSLVNIVKRLPGGEMFNAAALEQAKKSNEMIKNLITDIKDDENGVKYVYLATFDDSVGGDGESSTANDSASVVSSMAKRATS